MGEKVRISVVIPVYNAQEHLPQCLESVLQQEAAGLEILCVDDGSTDRSAAVLERYAARDRRIRVIRQRNQYAGIARNHGMQEARGEYIAFLDADDFYLPGALNGLYALAQRYRLDVVKGRFEMLDERDGRRYRTSYSRNDGVPKKRVLAFRERPVRLLHAADVPWNGLYRRAFLEAHGIRFNALRCINDHSFYIQCLLCAGRILFSPEAVACYRIGQAGSLVGQKAMHFDAQFDNFRIVQGLCRTAPPELARQILRCELNGLMEWYMRLSASAAQPEGLREQMQDFLRTLEEDAVGAAYVRTFPYREVYFALRYGSPPPGKGLAFPLQLARCWREHGLRYMWERFFARYQEEKHGTHTSD